MAQAWIEVHAFNIWYLRKVPVNWDSLQHQALRIIPLGDAQARETAVVMLCSLAFQHVRKMDKLEAREWLGSGPMWKAKYDKLAQAFANMPFPNCLASPAFKIVGADMQAQCMALAAPDLGLAMFFSVVADGLWGRALRVPHATLPVAVTLLFGVLA